MRIIEQREDYREPESDLAIGLVYAAIAAGAVAALCLIILLWEIEMSELTTTNGFALQPKDMTEAMTLATMISKSQLAPKDFRGKPEDTLVAMMLGNEVGLNPLQAIQNIAVINGRPSIWGDALLALVQNHPAFVSLDESFNESTMTATCTVVRKGGQPHVSTFSQEDAVAANLWGKQGPWKQYPKRMLAMRARGFALRNQFADALMGLVTREEAEDMPADARVINPQQAEEPKAIELDFYPEDRFKQNLPAWQEAINSKKKTVDDVIKTIQTRARLTEEQIINIKELGEAA